MYTYRRGRTGGVFSSIQRLIKIVRARGNFFEKIKRARRTFAKKSKHGGHDKRYSTAAVGRRDENASRRRRRRCGRRVCESPHGRAYTTNRSARPAGTRSAGVRAPTFGRTVPAQPLLPTGNRVPSRWLDATVVEVGVYRGIPARSLLLHARSTEQLVATTTPFDGRLCVEGGGISRGFSLISLFAPFRVDRNNNNNITTPVS